MAARPSDLHLLCVEDHKPLAKVIQLTFEHEGFHVHMAHRGEMVLEMARQIRPALILLDVMMPGMDGFQILKALQQDEVLKHIPVIMCTARDTAEDRSLALEAGAKDYISKPYDKADLVARVRLALNRPEQTCPR
ncbi:MAG: hypothetical protein AMXMBFR7_39900 [Planctomycetota bacterium]